ncbi:MAG: DUF5106 domain-containing protein [Muribaculaceae bacterium]|nr:DUF5106 domain-containing protein [Muribaculaceae bacterium]
MKSFLSALLLVISLFSASNAAAQATLFEYPIAPDTCTNIETRCNYSVQHFWDKCDFSKPFEAQNDSLLMEAMITYFDIMKAGANVNVALASVRNLMFKSQANHDNFMKLMSLAEYLLFFDSDFIDDLYLTFLQSAADASWMNKEKRNRYIDISKRIQNSKLGSPLYNFEFTSITGARKHLQDVKSTASMYVVIFSDNESGSSIERMRLSTDIAFNQKVEAGEIEVINIILGDTPKNWDKDSQTYSQTWIVGASKEVQDKLDLRIMPSIFLLDENFNIIAKNKTVDFIKNVFVR